MTPHAVGKRESRRNPSLGAERDIVESRQIPPLGAAPVPIRRTIPQNPPMGAEPTAHQLLNRKTRPWLRTIAAYRVRKRFLK